MQAPIGVFDSGMGGLTVLRELMRCLPDESFIYLGDTARLPYGTKSPETIIQYATQITHTLIAQGIKMLVIACNTATTAALPHLRQQFPNLPIVGVVEPGAKMAIETTKNNRIILLATETTLASGVYEATLKKLNPKVSVVGQSCGLFVALAEEGCVEDEIAYATVKKYLTPLIEKKDPYDCVVLACTHFPVLLKPLRDFLGPHVFIINSATATASAVKALLTENNLLAHPPIPKVRFLVSDLPKRFARVGEIFFGQPIEEQNVQLVDIQLILASQ